MFEKKKSEGSVFQNGWIITIIKTNKQTHNKKNQLCYSSLTTFSQWLSTDFPSKDPCKGSFPLPDIWITFSLTAIPKLCFFSKIISFYFYFLITFIKRNFICCFVYFPSFSNIMAIQDTLCLMVKHTQGKRRKGWVKETFLFQAKYKGYDFRSELTLYSIFWYVLSVMLHIWSPF